MPYLTVGKENGTNIEIYYKDWGSGQPIVFSHGWPLSADDWDAQMLFFLKQGLPRHCSRSSRAWPLDADQRRSSRKQYD
jgi:pimeloyl-ACP methyl ester carboxylesterase